MNDDKETQQSPGLKSLVDRYQETKAPLGFSERVAAHIKDEVSKPVHGSNVLASFLGSPKLIATMSFGLIAIFSVVVIQLTLETEPKTQQIAKQDKSDESLAPGKPDKFGVEKNQDVAPVKNKENDNIQIATSEEQVPEIQSLEDRQQIAKIKDPIISFEDKEQKTSNDELTNLAVLTDISDWLDSEEDSVVPELSELPDLDEIDNLFDTT